MIELTAQRSVDRPKVTNRTVQRLLAVTLTLALSAACTERLPQLPPEPDSGPTQLQGLTTVIEGRVNRGVDGELGTLPMPNARVEVLGVGSSTTDGEGRFRLPRLQVGLEDRTLEFLVYDRAQGVDAMPVARYQYELLAGMAGAISVDITIGARGSIKGRVALPEGTPPGGVIVFVEGVPGADDLSGPDGHFFLHGVPEGAVRVGFMYEDYVVAPRDLVEVTVSAYQATEIPETIQLTPPPGESALAPVTVVVDRHPDVPADGLEVVISPLLARPWSGSPAEGTEPVKVLPVPTDGRLELAFDYPEPHTVVLRQRAGASERPIRFARRVYVRPGDAPVHFNAGYGVASDESGQELGIDTDGDGVADAQDPDPDGDGCENEPELTALDPYSCGDRDGDGVADGFDPDDDGDGVSDLEELTPGSDGRTSDHREENTFERTAVRSPDGVVTILGQGTINQRVEADEFRTLIDRHHATFGNTLVTPIYEVQADTTSDPELLVQLFGYRGDEETLRLVVGSQRDPSWLNDRELPGVNLDCEDVGRGRKTCPVDAVSQALDGESYLVFISTNGATVTPLCGNGQVDGDEECDDGNPVDTDSCLTTCRTARCGDSFVQADVESCDDGNMRDDDACVGEACVEATCGDGFLRAGLADDDPAFEQCDDGDRQDSNHCTNQCREARCGDGVVNVEIPARDPSFEGCDDGNDNDDDGCRNNCMNEVLPGRLALSAFGGCRQTLDGVWSCWGDRSLGQFGDNSQIIDAGNGGHFEGQTDGYSVTHTYRFRAHRRGEWRIEAGPHDAELLCVFRDANGHVLNFYRLGNGCLFVPNVEAPATFSVSISGGRYDLVITPPQTDNLEDAGYNVLDRGSPSSVQRGSSLAAGASHKCVISPSGRVSCFGASNFGQAGVGQGDGPALEPVGIDMRPSVPGSLSVRGNIGCSVRGSDQRVMCWGQINADGQPNPQDYQVTSRRVFALMDGVCAQKEDGTIWCQGNNEVGSLGLGDAERLEAMTLVDSLGKPAQIQGAQWASLGGGTDQLDLCDGGTDCHNHTCVLHQDRSIRCTGANRWGQVGVAEPAIVREFTTVPFMGFPISLAVGGYHSCLLDIMGKVYCWGYNGFGQLGHEPSQELGGSKVPTPTEVPNLTGVTEIAAGAHHTCAMVGDQEVRCWGRNDEQQLGFVGPSTHVPTEVPRLLTNHAPQFVGDQDYNGDGVNDPFQSSVGEGIQPFVVTDPDGDTMTSSVFCTAQSNWSNEAYVWSVTNNSAIQINHFESWLLDCTLLVTDSTGRSVSYNFEVNP